MENSFDRAIRKAGGYAQVAKALGVRRQTVYKWRERLPLERIPEIERVTGLSRHDLRPDYFPVGQ